MIATMPLGVATAASCMYAAAGGDQLQAVFESETRRRDAARCIRQGSVPRMRSPCSGSIIPAAFAAAKARDARDVNRRLADVGLIQPIFRAVEADASPDRSRARCSRARTHPAPPARRRRSPCPCRRLERLGRDRECKSVLDSCDTGVSPVRTVGTGEMPVSLQHSSHTAFAQVSPAPNATKITTSPLLQLARAHRFIQRDRNRCGRGVAVFVDVHERLFRRDIRASPSRCR